MYQYVNDVRGNIKHNNNGTKLKNFRLSNRRKPETII